MFLIIMAAVSFISGSIPFCLWLPEIAVKKDICALSDDGNPGAFNVFSHCGKVLGCVCLALDVLKGFAPVFVAQLYGDAQSPTLALVIAAPVLGHAIGIFNGFRGGKCIAAAFGVTFGLIPKTYIVFLLALLYIVFSTVLKIADHAKRTILTFSVFSACSALILCGVGFFPLAAGCAAVGIAVIVKHI